MKFYLQPKMNSNTPKVLPEMSAKNIHNFWSNIAITANPTLCWIWNKHSDKSGYGKMTFLKNGKSVSVRCPRIAFYLYHQVDITDKVVLHSCDNPRCCNPNHLSLGTHKENTADMMNKGRGTQQFKSGENHLNVKLTESIVIKIKEDYAAGESQISLSKTHNVNQSTISRIIHNKRWMNNFHNKK